MSLNKPNVQQHVLTQAQADAALQRASEVGRAIAHSLLQLNPKSEGCGRCETCTHDGHIDSEHDHECHTESNAKPPTASKLQCG